MLDITIFQVNTGTESSQTTFPKYSSETANIYRETDSDNETEPNDDKLDSVCVQYSLPVSSEPKSKIGLSDVTSDTNSHNYHELEPTGEVAQSTGHHYHLLDVSESIIKNIYKLLHLMDLCLNIYFFIIIIF